MKKYVVLLISFYFYSQAIFAESTYMGTMNVEFTFELSEYEDSCPDKDNFHRVNVSELREARVDNSSFFEVSLSQPKVKFCTGNIKYEDSILHATDDGVGLAYPSSEYVFDENYGDILKNTHEHIYVVPKALYGLDFHTPVSNDKSNYVKLESTDDLIYVKLSSSFFIPLSFNTEYSQLIPYYTRSYLKLFATQGTKVNITSVNFVSGNESLNSLMKIQEKANLYSSDLFETLDEDSKEQLLKKNNVVLQASGYIEEVLVNLNTKHQ